MKKQNVRTSILLIATSTYLLIGAGVFDKLESANESEERERLNSSEYEMKIKYNMTEMDFELLRKNIILSRTYKAGIQWKFGGAFYFALSVITTIGYGHSTPKTIGGKIFCIIYAVFGIPLNIVMFQSIGERFNIFLHFFLRKGKQCFRCRRTKVSDVELILLGGFLCILVLVGGAVAFQNFEHWNFIDSLYFCFITMSTIGFGDFVALQNETTAALQTQPGYVTFCIVYIVCGLTVFAAALNQMVLRLLTLNTEDERKDEEEARKQAEQAPTLDGDMIMPPNLDDSLQRGAAFNLQVLNENGCIQSSRSSKLSQPSLKLSISRPQVFTNDCRNHNLFRHHGNHRTSSKARFARKKFRLPKHRYSASRTPSATVIHLLPMQSDDTLLLQTKYGMNIPRLSLLSVNQEKQNGGYVAGLGSPGTSNEGASPLRETENMTSNEIDLLITPSPKRFSC